MQEVFDKTVNHLRKQGRKAMDDEGRCKYRTWDNLRCAVGCHIPDEYYSPALEGTSIYTADDNWEFLMEALGFSEDEFKLLSDLQKTHDNESVGNWEPDFKRVAKKYQLVYTAP